MTYISYMFRQVAWSLISILELMMLVQTVRIIAIAAISWAARRLDISDMPRLGTQYAQERRRIHRTGALLHIIWFC